MDSSKIHRVLSVVLCAFLAVGLRVWHLGTVQREEKRKEVDRPRQRTLLLRADRGTICDRAGTPLATSKICYCATVYYGQIAEIPSFSWKEEGGKKIKTYPRREHIRELSKVLAKILRLDAERVEDLIHSKAALFPHVPYPIKEGISEGEYYRLRALERDWAGLHAEISSRRIYPQGKLASHLIGTMGAISAKEYDSFTREALQLQEALDLYEQGIDVPLPRGIASFEEGYRRFSELKERAYAIRDLVGKSGIEAEFEEGLRGFFGKKILEVDQKGRCVRELPEGRAPVAGRKITLSISAELQRFAEELLIKSEAMRDGKSTWIDPADKVRKPQKQPWIKGGAIVALDPNTGEVLAMASHPRFDPNDFIPAPEKEAASQRRLCQWLENERWIAAIWDGKEPLQNEGISAPLTWGRYLDFLLPKEGSSLRSFFQKMEDVKGAIQIQEDFEALLYFSGVNSPLKLVEALSDPAEEGAVWEALHSHIDTKPILKRFKAHLQTIIADPRDQLFALDLCRLVVDATRFTDPLIERIGAMKLGTYRALCQAFQKKEAEVRAALRETFRRGPFQKWKEEHQREFLVAKRKEEKGRYAKPYLDYLDQKEEELFAAFYSENRLALLAEKMDCPEIESLPRELIIPFLRTFRSYEELCRPLFGQYRALRSWKKEQTEKELAAAFYPIGGFGFLRSFAFQSGVPQGSLFKLVTGYEALQQGAILSLVDDASRSPDVVAYTPQGSPYPRMYKGGRLPRSSLFRIGEIDLVSALEQSSNPFFSILAGDFFRQPEDLATAARLFGFGEKTGIELPGEIAGNIPSDLSSNRTGLYSFAIGQHTLLVTPLQTAVMLASLANGGKVLKPKLVLAAEGLSPRRAPLDAFSSENAFAKKELAALGIHFPLFTGAQHSAPSSKFEEAATEVRRTLPLSPAVRAQLLTGMDRVIWGKKGRARPVAIKALLADPSLMRNYLSLRHQMVGKTGTAELLCNTDRNPSSRAQMYKYVWSGAISFEEVRWERPELVVVVFLRYGDSGKETMPFAAQMIQKWREIKKNLSHKSYTIYQN